MTELERSKFAIWDYPVSDRYTKIWATMKEAGLPKTFEEALERVRNSTSTTSGYAFIGDGTDIRYNVMTNCDLLMVGEEFSKKPYAFAVQQGDPLKDQLNDALVAQESFCRDMKKADNFVPQDPETIEYEATGALQGQVVDKKPEKKGLH